MKLRDRSRGISMAGKLPVMLAAAGIVGVVVYAALAATPLAAGPELNLLPVTTLEGNTVRIEGTALRVSRVSINGMDIPLAEDGTFAVERSFPAGYTVLTVRAEDRFLRVRERTITFIMHSYAKEDDESSEEDRDTDERFRESEGGEGSGD